MCVCGVNVSACVSVCVCHRVCAWAHTWTSSITHFITGIFTKEKGTLWLVWLRAARSTQRVLSFKNARARTAVSQTQNQITLITC